MIGHDKLARVRQNCPLAKNSSCLACELHYKSAQEKLDVGRCTFHAAPDGSTTNSGAVCSKVLDLSGCDVTVVRSVLESGQKSSIEISLSVARTNKFLRPSGCSERFDIIWLLTGEALMLRPLEGDCGGPARRHLIRDSPSSCRRARCESIPPLSHLMRVFALFTCALCL